PPFVSLFPTRRASDLQSEVADYLGRLGVRPHGYNVVMQGDITRIIEMSDLDRRRVIDEIAGVAEFDLRRNQAFAELEVVKERIEDRKSTRLNSSHVKS